RAETGSRRRRPPTARSRREAISRPATATGTLHGDQSGDGNAARAWSRSALSSRIHRADESIRLRGRIVCSQRRHRCLGRAAVTSQSEAQSIRCRQRVRIGADGADTRRLVSDMLRISSAIVMLAWVLFAAAVHAAELPIFDAHIHYSEDAWNVVSPKEAIEILRSSGVKRALVSSSN